jgi:protein gp37
MTTQNKTLIPYLDKIWTTVVGCSHCGPGCAYCFAEQRSYRLGQMGLKDYQGLHVCIPSRRGEDDVPVHRWNGVVRCLPHKLGQFFKEWSKKSKKPSLIGVNFMSDTFHERVPDEFLFDLMRVIFRCPQHRFFILTKRAARMRKFFEECWRGVLKHSAPIPNNLVIGASCSTQDDYDKLVPDLLATPAACHMISFEPLLGPIELWHTDLTHKSAIPAGIIIGCESGPKRRPMFHMWAFDLIEQATRLHIPVYLKQICENEYGLGKLLKEEGDIIMGFGQCPRELPALLQNTLRKGPRP